MKEIPLGHIDSAGTGGGSMFFFYVYLHDICLSTTNEQDDDRACSLFDSPESCLINSKGEKRTNHFRTRIQRPIGKLTVHIRIWIVKRSMVKLVLSADRLDKREAIVFHMIY